jgi:simple sugar transport system permease protein
VLGAYQTGNPWLGVLRAICAGVLTAWLHAEVTVRFRADQITSGLGINLLAAGSHEVRLTQVFHSSSNSSRVVGLPSGTCSGSRRAGARTRARDTARAGRDRCRADRPAVLFRSVFGLRLRAMGEHPEAAATLGLSVALPLRGRVRLGRARGPRRRRGSRASSTRSPTA